MNYILAINSGSTSLKYALLNAQYEKLLSAELTGHKITGKIFSQIQRQVRQAKIDLKNLIVLHRVVHGGHEFHNITLLTNKTIPKIRAFDHLAPLHNPFNLAGIELGRKYFPECLQYAVFDTAFFYNLPLVTKMYPLPPKFYAKNHIQRYGFHGISHQYALRQAQNKLKNNQPNIISLHLGGGCSMTAIKKGRPVDTSMGYTPLEGLMMWSRSGDIDPGIVLNLPTADKDHLLNHDCGLKAISGARDYLELLARYEKGESKAKSALQMFVYRIQKYLGAYFAVLGGEVDAVVFTGKIGSGEALTRTLILRDLPFLRSAARIVIPADEEMMMAWLFNETVKLLK